LIIKSDHLPLVPEGRRILAGGGTTGRVESKFAQPQRGDRRDSGLPPRRGWEMRLGDDSGGFTTG
jgi:hypothetical protein